MIYRIYYVKKGNGWVSNTYIESSTDLLPLIFAREAKEREDKVYVIHNQTKDEIVYQDSYFNKSINKNDFVRTFLKTHVTDTPDPLIRL